MKSLIGNRLLIENVPYGEQKTEAGLIIAETVVRPKKGRVFKVGLTVADEIKRLGGKAITPDDEVLYEPQDYPGLTIDDKTYDTVLLDSLICVL